MKRFLNLIVYILSVHLSALIITGLFRGVLFISSYHQLTAEALSDKKSVIDSIYTWSMVR